MLENAVLRSLAMFRHRCLVLVLATAALIPAACAADVRLDPLQKDFAQYLVYAGTRLLGTEQFSFQPASDSVAVFANVDETIPTPNGDQKLVKKIQLMMKAIDYDVIGYGAEEHLFGRTVLRGVVVSDTLFTAYREADGHGVGDRYVRPPGRMFIIDSQTFVLFDVLLRSLHGKPTADRTTPVFVLGEPRDTILQVSLHPEARDEKIEWGKDTLNTRRYTISDGSSEFIAWVGPDGRMLRLEQPASGLRVIRDPKPMADPTAPAAPAKKPSAKKPAPAKPPASATPAKPPGR
jgi:hypothetical protein